MPIPAPPTQYLFKNILFATDFSDFSERAMPYVLGLARRYGSTVFVIHAIPPNPRLSVPLDALPVECDQARYHAENAMHQFLKTFPTMGIHFELLVEKGDVDVVFSRAVAEHDINLVVLATHGRRGMGKLLFGSVAEEVFRAVSCPVLIIGPDVVHNELASGEAGRILYATDFSPSSQHAFDHSVSLARQLNAGLILFHVVGQVNLPLYYRDSIVAQAHEELRAMLPKAEGLNFEPQCIVKVGDPAEEILSMAADLRCSLIVLGTHQTSSGRLSAHLPWGVTHRVATSAACPVLTIRAPLSADAGDAGSTEVSHAA